MEKNEQIRFPFERGTIGNSELVTQRTWRSNICQECTIENYSDLKESTNYFMTREIEGTERTLKLYKTKRSHFFQLHCELKNTTFKHNDGLKEDKMVFYIMYQKDKPVWSGDLAEKEYGYSIDVPSELILHADNRYLHEDNALVIQFNYKHYTYSRFPIARSGRATEDDEEAFSNDMLSLYSNQEFEDLSLSSADGKEFNIHAVICHARSDRLRHFLTKRSGSLSLKLEPRIVDLGLRYMYSGKLDDVPLDDLISLLDFAEKCGLSSLRHSLTVAIREKLNKDNCRRIHETATTFQLSDLQKYARDFIPKEDFDKEEKREKKASKLRKTRRQR